MTLTYGCICSGVSAPTLAVKTAGLDWRCAFFSEIEAAPRAVLKYRYPHTPIHGDFTTIEKDNYGPVDILIGGTPCQSFSVAGKRLGLDDPRGNLALEYIRLGLRLGARWLPFENVPGLLSSAKGEDFSTFISAFTGFTYRTPPGGWQNAGIADGLPGRYGIAWRVLDAQYFGVAQRRRRLLVIGYTGDWRPAAAVLFERESLHGHPAPRREAGQGITHATAGSLTGSGRGVARPGESRGQDPVIAVMSQGQGGAEITLNGLGTTLTCNHEAPILAHTLRAEGFDASEDGTGRGVPLVPTAPIAFDCKASGQAGFGVGSIASTMRSMNSATGHHNGGGHMAVAYPIDMRNAGRDPDKHDAQNRQGCGLGDDGDPCGTVSTAFVPGVATATAVRRLTPRECERLQGFPDDYTLVPYRGRMMADGPRYKMCGNSMARPFIQWAMERIDTVEKILAGLA